MIGGLRLRGQALLHTRGRRDHRRWWWSFPGRRRRWCSAFLHDGHRCRFPCGRHLVLALVASGINDASRGRKGESQHRSDNGRERTTAHLYRWGSLNRAHFYFRTEQMSRPRRGWSTCHIEGPRLSTPGSRPRRRQSSRGAMASGVWAVVRRPSAASKWRRVMAMRSFASLAPTASFTQNIAPLRRRRPPYKYEHGRTTPSAR